MTRSMAASASKWRRRRSENVFFVVLPYSSFTRNIKSIIGQPSEYRDYLYPEINQEKCCGRGVGVPGVVKFESGVVIHVIFSVYYRTTVVAMGAKRKHVK